LPNPSISLGKGLAYLPWAANVKEESTGRTVRLEFLNKVYHIFSRGNRQKEQIINRNSRFSD